MKNATLRQLRLFAHAAHTLSFADTARALHLTPPAVSIQLKQLEGHVGTDLFEQIGKRMQLTFAGREMLTHVNAIIDQIRAAEESLRLLQGLEGGELNVGAISAGDHFFPYLLAEFRRRHPGIGLKLRIMNREQLHLALLSGELDLGISGRPPDRADIVGEPFAPHPSVIICHRKHPLAKQARVPLADLKGEPFIVRERGSGTRIAMEETFTKRRVVPVIAMELGSNETIKRAVAAGFGLGFVSAHVIAFDIRAKRLAVVDVEGFPVMRRWHVIERRNRRLPPAAFAFKRMLLAEGAKLIEAALKR